VIDDVKDEVKVVGRSGGRGGGGRTGERGRVKTGERGRWWRRGSDFNLKDQQREDYNLPEI